MPPLLRFFLIDAVWSGADREACLASPAQPNPGACWAFVRVWFSYFVYGFYPIGARWRVDVFFLRSGVRHRVAVAAPGAAPRSRRRLFLSSCCRSCRSFCCTALRSIGLAVVPTALWGGILVTIVVATIGIVFSLPLGILLALGRRSDLPVVRLLAVSFIEFVRGVPLITVLFMASVMLPLFVPERFAPDKLVRALIGVALFASAYMAEVVRGGLVAVPRGQYEAARALGLTYWRMMGLVILPQALRVTLPNIVNTFIGLFKDTTLVFVVGHFRLPAHHRGGARRSEMGGAEHAVDRLRFRRALLLHLLLWHVALRARRGNAAGARRPAVRGSDGRACGPAECRRRR